MANDAPLWFADPAAAAYPTADPLTEHRNERYQWDLLTLDGAPAGTLDGVTSGTLDWSTGNTIKGGGNLTWERRPNQEPIDFTQHMLQPWYTIVSQAGEEVAAWPLGVFIPATPGDDWDDTGATASIDLYDKLLILEEDSFTETYTVQAGEVATTVIRDIITGAGQTKIAVEDSTHTIRSDMAWETGITKLHIINEILESINYFSLWCDGEGTYRADGYTAPSARPVAYDFKDDQTSIYLPQFVHRKDLFAVPNRVTLLARTDGTDEVLKAVAENQDPNSRTSIPYRGRVITRFEDNVEASSLTVLQGLAERRLAAASQVASTIELEHALVPLQLNDAVTFRREPAGLDLRAVVQSLSITCTPGSLARTTIREVVS